jgi:molybdate transport system substrate-binding protein
MIPSIVLIGVVAALLLALPGVPFARAQETRTLTILAASSLTDAFNAIKTAFEAANPTVKIAYSFGASSTLATQLKEGAPADLFASASASQMAVAVEAKRIAGKPRTFARNRLVLAVPVDNPGKVTSLKDLARPGLKLAVGRPKVPVRDYADAMLAKLAQTSGYGAEYQAAVIKNFIEFDNVRQVSAQVASGEVDAGLVYRSDVTPDIASRVTVLPIPDAINTLATYPIGITDNTPNPDAAKAFVDFVLSDAGQAILVQWNFISIRIPPQPAAITLGPGPGVQVRGQLLNPLTLTVDDLKANYVAQVARVKYASGNQTVSAMFTGVLLRDVLDSAQLNTDPDTPNDKLSLYIMATGRDGYQALIAYAEIDPEFGAQPILIAYEQDGKPITTMGPLRLVVPGDARGGRYVGALASLDIRRGPTVSR